MVKVEKQRELDGVVDGGSCLPSSTKPSARGHKRIRDLK